MSKVNETVFRGDIEKDFSAWVQATCQPEEDEKEVLSEELFEITGFAIVLGPWIVHMLEGHNVMLNQYITKLRDKVNYRTEKGSYYHNCFVLHY